MRKVTHTYAQLAGSPENFRFLSKLILCYFLCLLLVFDREPLGIDLLLSTFYMPFVFSRDLNSLEYFVIYWFITSLDMFAFETMSFLIDKKYYNVIKQY
jgi:hypothetical protein